MEDLLKVGVITTTHGVRGEVKVFPTTDDAERFLDIEYVLLDTGKELRRLNIQNVKFFKNLAILKFEGIDNINDIEMYKGRELWIPREANCHSYAGNCNPYETGITEQNRGCGGSHRNGGTSGEWGEIRSAP